MKFLQSLASIGVLALLFGCGTAPSEDKESDVVGVVQGSTGPGPKPMVPQEGKAKPKRVRPPAVVDP